MDSQIVKYSESLIDRKTDRLQKKGRERERDTHTHIYRDREREAGRQADR